MIILQFTMYLYCNSCSSIPSKPLCCSFTINAIKPLTCRIQLFSNHSILHSKFHFHSTPYHSPTSLRYSSGKSLEIVQDIYEPNSPHSPQDHSKTRFYLPTPTFHSTEFQNHFKEDCPPQTVHKSLYQIEDFLFTLSSCKPLHPHILTPPPHSINLFCSSLIPTSTLPKELD